MEKKDFVTIGISVIALLFSLISLIFTYLNYKRNLTRLKIEQLHLAPDLLGIRITPNKLFLDGEQNKKLWEVMPMIHLVLYLKIDNLSYTGITISSLVINDEFWVSKINVKELKKELLLNFFASEKCCNKELKIYGHTNRAFCNCLRLDDYSFINVGDRIEAKSSIEGVIIISGNWDLYNVIKDGINKFTIVTPDKKFDKYVEIDKTVIPHLSEE